jgi:hypothetical protein
MTTKTETAVRNAARYLRRNGYYPENESPELEGGTSTRWRRADGYRARVDSSGGIRFSDGGPGSVYASAEEIRFGLPGDEPAADEEPAEEESSRSHQPSRETERAELVANAINAFGTGQHPWARPANLSGFRAPYIVECLSKALSHSEGALREFVAETIRYYSQPGI